MSQPRNPSQLCFQKLPYILQAYQHTCLQRNEAGERVSSRMVGIGYHCLMLFKHPPKIMLFQKVFIPLHSEYKKRQIIAVCFRFGAIVPITFVQG